MGGRRRSSLKPAIKRKPKLDKVFVCPYCSQDGCSVTLEKKVKPFSAKIECQSCGVEHKYRGNVTYLTEQIDVYSDWVDAKENTGKPKRMSKMPKKPRVQSSHHSDEEEEEEKPTQKKGSKKQKLVQSEEEEEEEEQEEDHFTNSAAAADEEEFA